MGDRTVYNYMENALQFINRNHISLPEDEVERNNQVLEYILQQIIEKMKEADVLFKTTFSRVFYGGSYYDGLKVGKPDEFDLNFLLTLPEYAEPDLTNSDIPGFMFLRFENYYRWSTQSHRWGCLSRLLDRDHYLLTSEVSSWIESVIAKALNAFPKSYGFTYFNTPYGMFQGTLHKEGPAHTLKLCGPINSKNITIDVDLVPCFVFTKEKWPKSPYRPNPVSNKSEFSVVPKKPKVARVNVNRYWRLSFQEQERELLSDLRTLKPTIKLLKKLRDNENHEAMASYFIKTIFLWEVTNNEELWNESLSYVFMLMLKKYQQYLRNREIPYYWNRNNNLLKDKDATVYIYMQIEYNILLMILKGTQEIHPV